MTTLLQKLQVKTPGPTLVQGLPDDVRPLLTGLELHEQPLADRKFTLVLCFARTLAEVEWGAQLVGNAVEDALVWFAYPKSSSKNYRCEFNRDTGWAALGAMGFEPVRQVAIDDDWSALRFRKVEKIGKLTRSSAISKEGQKRVASAKGKKTAARKKV